MERDWDINSNSEEDVVKALEEEQATRWATYRTQWERRQAVREREYINPPEIGETTVREMFSNFTDWRRHPDWPAPIANWGANRVVYICHNCGAFGYKAGRTNPLFKCYACHSRYLTVLRAGEISLAIRNQNVGINMEEVYRERKQAQRRARAERKRQSVREADVHPRVG